MIPPPCWSDMEQIARALIAELTGLFPHLFIEGIQDHGYWTVFVGQENGEHRIECIFGEGKYDGQIFIYYEGRKPAKIYHVGEPDWIDKLVKDIGAIPWKSA